MRKSLNKIEGNSTPISWGHRLQTHILQYLLLFNEVNYCNCTAYLLTLTRNSKKKLCYNIVLHLHNPCVYVTTDLRTCLAMRQRTTIRYSSDCPLLSRGGGRYKEWFVLGYFFLTRFIAHDHSPDSQFIVNPPSSFLQRWTIKGLNGRHPSDQDGVFIIWERPAPPAKTEHAVHQSVKSGAPTSGKRQTCMGKKLNENNQKNKTGTHHLRQTISIGTRNKL